MLFSLICERWWKDFVSIVLLTFALAVTITSWTSYGSLNNKDYWLNTVRGTRQDDAIISFLPADTISATNHHEYGNDDQQQQRQLILHVGPPKTATTSLQTDLTTYQNDLMDDGYWYAGRYYDLWTNETDGKTHKGRSESKLLNETHDMLNYCHATNLTGRVDCCRSFARELNEVVERSGFRRIVISEEPLGVQWDDPEDWLAIREAVGDQWNITVLVGYRRFYSWWISAHFQRERTDRSHNHQNDLWPEQGGRAKAPLFPTWWHGWTKSSYRPTSVVLENIGDTFPVQIINLHDENLVSPSRMMLCEVLDTPQACAKIEQVPETVLNTQEDAPSLFYDAIATDAAAMGLIDINARSRIDVRELVRVYHEEELGLGPDDLPMTCPPLSDLNALLNMSLSIEAQYLPNFATSRRIAEHEAEFWATNFCFVDTGKVLALVAWIDFFAALQ
jgi:hypothetical protein